MDPESVRFRAREILILRRLDQPNVMKLQGLVTSKQEKISGSKGRGVESFRKGSKESKAVPTPDANTELPASIQKWKAQSNPKSSSENYNPQEDGGSGFPIEPSGRSLIKGHLGQNGASSTHMGVNEAEAHTDFILSAL